MATPFVRLAERGWEPPTLALTAVIYGGWLALTWFWTDLPLLLTLPLGAWLLAWHGSLQHEIIHGHPTPHRRLNRALGEPPLGLWLPFAVYRRLHLRHHREPFLTDPIEDPESAYVTGLLWERLGWLGRTLQHANQTLLGRLIIGPFLSLTALWGGALSRIRAGDRELAYVWLRHLAGSGLVLAWLGWVCGVPLWLYALGCIVPSIALTRLRAFAEHRFADEAAERTAVVESGGPLGLLFLHNNLHVVHHLWPNVPWYQIPTLYRQDRARFLQRNGGLVYRGYRDVARRFLLRPHDAPVHPRYGSGHEAQARIA